ncbi:MAG: hypothetical protein E7478_06435 [Ruminococcaceae bacterium]|nr:hypothetical protein [Oscillospiraceae bacterium]
MDGFVWWHYVAIYAVLAMFYGWGVLCAGWGTGQQHSRSHRPVALFMSRAAVVLPVGIYCGCCGALGASTALVLYIVPAQLIVFKGGYSAYGRNYHDIFGRGWFAMFYVSAVIVSVLLWFSRDEALISSGNYQLCIAFGVLIVISAILTNQTNIDSCTHQRDAGKMALPVGLRAYNTKLCAAVTLLIVSLFLFAPPVAKFIAKVLKNIAAWLLSLVRGADHSASGKDILSGAENGSGIAFSDGGIIFDVLYLVLGAAIVFLVIKYHRQIMEFMRETFAFLFSERGEHSDLGYHDEFIGIPDERLTLNSRRKLENQLYKKYIRENDPVIRYRIGYRIMLLRLCDTPFAVLASDNTDIHAVKGENGLRSEKVRSIVSTYNKVRYGGYIPTKDEIHFEAGFINEIRRKI